MALIINGGPAIGQPYAPLQIKTGGRDVVASGSVITANNRNLEFQLANLRVVFLFETDAGPTRMGTASASGSSLHLPLFNFNNSIGAGTTAPIEIGTLSGQKLLLSFMVYALNPESTKTVHYTFMLGDRV